MIIVNADDWGRSREETDAAQACFSRGTVTSATGMVFMADSERGASIARDIGMNVGLHLNLSERFTGNVQSKALGEQHSRVVRFLKSNRYALILYNPLLRSAFQQVYSAQLEEFFRLYGRAPSHVDGHQHMHLCSNVLIGGLIAKGTKVRRSFSFAPGQKGFLNRFYRGLVDRCLARRYRITEYFFALSQTLQGDRLSRVITLARGANVELETHPVVPAEKALLLSDEFCANLSGVQRASYAVL